MIAGMEVSQRDLLAGSEGQSQPAGLAAGVVCQRNAANDEAGCSERCGLAIG